MSVLTICIFFFLATNTDDGIHPPKIDTGSLASHPKFPLEQMKRTRHFLESNLSYSDVDIK